MDSISKKVALAKIKNIQKFSAPKYKMKIRIGRKEEGDRTCGQCSRRLNNHDFSPKQGKSEKQYLIDVVKTESVLS